MFIFQKFYYYYLYFYFLRYIFNLLENYDKNKTIHNLLLNNFFYIKNINFYSCSIYINYYFSIINENFFS